MVTNLASAITTVGFMCAAKKSIPKPERAGKLVFVFMLVKIKQ